MKIAIVGSGLAGLSAAVNLVDEGHEVEIYESRSFWGGKVGSWEDKDGNHIEMGLHVFFYNYANLFKLMKKVGALDNLLPKASEYAEIISKKMSLGLRMAKATLNQIEWMDLKNAYKFEQTQTEILQSSDEAIAAKKAFLDNSNKQ